MVVEKFDIKINLTPDISLNVKINSVMNHEEFLGFIQQIEGLFKPFVKQQMNVGIISEQPQIEKPHKKKGVRDNIGIGRDKIEKYAPKVISLMNKKGLSATEAFRQLLGFVPTGEEYSFMRKCGIPIKGKFSKPIVKKTRKSRVLSPELAHFMSERMKIINEKTKALRIEFPNRDITSIRKEAVEYFENVIKPKMKKEKDKPEEKKKFNAPINSVEEAFKMFGGD